MWVGNDTEYTGYDNSNEKKVVKSKRKNGHYHSDNAIKKFGEVFTPDKLVNEMLDKLPPQVFTDKDKTFLDNSCGNGQFLYWVMYRKMRELMPPNGGRPSYKAHRHALSTIYGVELDPQNAEECRLRLLRGSTSQELRDIVNHNIICADGLDQHHEGWSKVGFYWDENLKPDPKVIAARAKAKEVEVSKAKVLEKNIPSLPDSKKVVEKNKHISEPLPLEVKPPITSSIPLVSTISEKEFYERIQGKIEQDDEF